MEEFIKSMGELDEINKLLEDKLGINVEKEDRNLLIKKYLLSTIDLMAVYINLADVLSNEDLKRLTSMNTECTKNVYGVLKKD